MRVRLRGEVLITSPFRKATVPMPRLLGLFVSSTPNVMLVTLPPCLGVSSLDSPPNKFITVSSSWLSSPRTDVSGIMFSEDCAARACVVRLGLRLVFARLGDGLNSVPCVTDDSISTILQREGKEYGIKWMGMDM